LSRWLIVPCFNEAQRLDRARILSYTSALQCNVLLVNDASTDTTQILIDEIVRSSNGSVHSMILSRNSGKAEAVRSGMQRAIGHEATEVGYTDADGSVKESDLLQLFSELDSDVACTGVLGSRVALLGRDIKRNAVRHFSGRVFATFASLILKCPIYDSQCGAKVFKVSTQLQNALSVSFVSRWGFDIELIGRLLRQTNSFSPHGLREFPLSVWHDVSGSKLKSIDGVKTFIELFAIRRSLSQWPLYGQETPTPPMPQ
jgi:dolichyl-phosphate beta-glucosyltransferase